jgi:hypothetical protein
VNLVWQPIFELSPAPRAVCREYQGNTLQKSHATSGFACESSEVPFARRLCFLKSLAIFTRS